MTSSTGHSLSRLADDLRNLAPDPASGLGDDLFLLISTLTPMVNVDLLIKDINGKTLLIWRDDRHYPAGWHIPGGIVRFQENWSARIRQVAQSELGMEVTFDTQPIAVNQVIRPGHAERGHFISLLFECRPLSMPDPMRAQQGAAPLNGEWCWHDCFPTDMIPVQSIYKRYF